MKTQLTDLSLTELQKRRSTVKGALIVFIILAVVAAGVLIYLKPKAVAAYIPILVLPIMWLPIIISLTTINKEISSRKITDLAKA